MSEKPLVCKELIELVTDYLEDTLSPADRARFEAHIAGCSGCTNYLEQMKQTIRFSGRLSVDDLTPEAKDAMLKIFTDWKREQS